MNKPDLRTTTICPIVPQEWRAAERVGARDRRIDHAIILMANVVIGILVAVLIAALVLGCQKPIPYTFEQRREWAPAPITPAEPIGTTHDAGGER